MTFGRGLGGSARKRTPWRYLACSCVLLLACNARPIPPVDDIPPEVRAYTRARCQTLDACGCASDTYADRTECEDDIIAVFEEHLADDDTLDLACFESAAQAWGRDLCDDPPFDEPCDVVEPTHEIGEWCPDLDLLRDPFARVPWCADGLVCWSGRCVETVDARQQGEPCSTDGLCGTAELACYQGLCELRQPEGGACETNANCEFGGLDVNLHCVDGTCVNRRSNGEPCMENTECMSQLCIGGQCTMSPAIVCFSAEL